MRTRTALTSDAIHTLPCQWQATNVELQPRRETTLSRAVSHVHEANRAQLQHDASWAIDSITEKSVAHRVTEPLAPRPRRCDGVHIARSMCSGAAPLITSRAAAVSPSSTSLSSEAAEPAGINNSLGS